MNATINFAQIVKKTMCSKTKTQYNSNNSLTPALKQTSFEKRSNLDDLINKPIKAEERSVIQVSFRTQGSMIRQAQSGISVKNHVTADPRSTVFSKSANPLDLR